MDDNALANNLHRLMSEARLTSSELGRHLNLPAATIKKLRTGDNKNPTITTLLPIAKHFGINISQLIGEEDINQTTSNQHYHNNAAADEICEACLLTKVVPLIEWSETIKWDPTSDTSINRQQIVLEKSVSKNSYALQLDIDYSLFKKGGLIIISPIEVNLKNPNYDAHNIYALIHKIGQPTPSIKKVLAEDGDIYIQSLLPSLNITQALTKDYKIIGNIIAYKKWFA